MWWVVWVIPILAGVIGWLIADSQYRKGMDEAKRMLDKLESLLKKENEKDNQS